MKVENRELIFSKIKVICEDYLTSHGYEVQEKKCYLYGKRTEQSDIPVNELKEELYNVISKGIKIKIQKVLNLCRITAYDNSCYIHFKKEVE